eukprot:scaffold347978_cov41-Prasinocladus_malaysianus.AAC.1
MSASYLAAMGEAILTARAASTLKGKGTMAERSALLLKHSLLQLLAAMLSAAGFAAIYINKERLGKSHFRQATSTFRPEWPNNTFFMESMTILWKYPTCVTEYVSVQDMARVYWIGSARVIGRDLIGWSYDILQAYSVAQGPWDDQKGAQSWRLDSLHGWCSCRLDWPQTPGPQPCSPQVTPYYRKTAATPGSLTYILVAATVMGVFGAAFARIPIVSSKKD